MHVTEILKDEHAVIERVLDLLTISVERVEADKSLLPGFLLWAIDFTIRFTQHYHDEKEEEVLFPLLEERGIPREDGPIEVMLQEHGRGRTYVRRMYEALQNDDDASLVKETANYVALLRQHIAKENTALFPMAQDQIGADDDAAAVEKYQSIEQKHGGPALRDGFEDDIRQWEKTLGAVSSHRQ